MPTYTPEQYARRDHILLYLTGLDRILIARCAAAALASGKPVTHAINRLVDSGDLLRYERVLPGGLTIYTLSPTAASRLAISRDRAELPSGAALDIAIAVQVFSHLGRHPRYRLSSAEAAELLEGAAPANVPFVLSDELGAPAVFRVVLAANRTLAESIRHLRTLVDQAERHAKLSSWVASKQLGFAVLAQTFQHATELERLVNRSGVLKRAAVIVDVGPDAEHLAAVLKERKGT
jgi:hypothetical protein